MTIESMEAGPEAALMEALAERAQQIETCLESLLPLEAGLEARLIDAMRYATLGGGKRLRGFLVMEWLRCSRWRPPVPRASPPRWKCCTPIR